MLELVLLSSSRGRFRGLSATALSATLTAEASFVSWSTLTTAAVADDDADVAAVSAISLRDMDQNNQLLANHEAVHASLFGHRLDLHH